MKVNDVVDVTVVAVHRYGIEVERHGRPGFIQVVELTWRPGPVVPADVAAVGDALRVLVYAITPERFYASIKRAVPELDPWTDPTLFEPGTRHLGVVRRLFDWGCSVAVEPGVWGVILRGADSPTYSVGERITVVVESLDVSRKTLIFRPIQT